ncbi:MAG TPA: efflux RND transporter periplasmic adaptor subunit, partial [Phycisphaerales bacterium]|nr:efflux RND transporter periplasmic adaptor subunit [Phycisphaerales bacterium]
FDGYYMLSDILEIPNLMQRSTTMLKYWGEKIIFRVRDIFPPTSSPGEQAILTVYGVGAMIYRVVLFFSITLYVMGQMFGLGLVLAVWTAAMWFILPLGGFIHYLAANPKIADGRPRVIATSLGLAALIAIIVGVIPMPDRRYGDGVVESPARRGIFAGVDGFVTASYVRPGDRVRAGDILLSMDSEDLRSQRETVEAMIRENESLESEYMTQNQAMAQIAREKLATLQEQLTFIDERTRRLTVVAPIDGVVVGPDPSMAIGMFAREGSPLCEIVDSQNVRVAAELGQTEGSWLFELPRDQLQVELRTLSQVDRVVPATVERIIDAGQRELAHAALGVGGGGVIETDPKDRSGRQTKRPIFRVNIAGTPESGVHIGSPGERVRIRFTLPDKPLMAQWIDRLQKIVQGRVNI